MRALVFGAMPEGARPESHIASGPWCFCGREALFPGWDGCGPPGRAFPLPPDPFADASSVEKTARAANGEALRLARLFSGRLWGQAQGTKEASFPSERFALLALGPFLLLACHMLAERQKRVLDLVGLYGNDRLRVELLPEDIPFSFTDSLDFMLHGVQDAAFNHYAYSRIVEALAPEKWDLRYTSAALHMGREPGRQPFILHFKDCLRKVLLRMPFPRCKGFGFPQMLLLSLAVLTNKRRREDASLDFSLYCDAPLDWLFPAEKLLEACLPLALRQARPPAGAAVPASRPGPLRGMSPAYGQDESYRLHLAALKEKGCRLFCVQHGANYGNLQSVGGLPFEYSQHAFFTWGWRRHENVPANAVPLAHPALAAIANAHKEKSPSLILVGTEMSSFSYRLKSRPQAAALPAYRQGKVAFLRPMQEYFSSPASPEPDSELLYRPYFKVAGGLDDAEYLQRLLPGLRICKGDLTRRMLECRLLVLDHYGTTLHMALAANVPCLAFWKPESWGMEKETQRHLPHLENAGILHASPESAAGKAREVWPDIQSWWRSAAVRTARQRWLAAYADTGEADRPLSGARLALRWFKALRDC